MGRVGEKFNDEIKNKMRVFRIKMASFNEVHCLFLEWVVLE